MTHVHAPEDRHERLRDPEAAARGRRARAGPPAHRAAGLARRPAGRAPDPPLRELVRIATERSPWYRKRLSGVDIDRLDETTLAELPVLTKAELMEHFDDIVTDSRLSLAGLEAHLSTVETGTTCSAATPR